MRGVLLATAVLSGVFSAILLGRDPSGPFAAWSSVVGLAAMVCAVTAGALALLWPWFRCAFVLKDHTPELRTSARREFGERYR